MKEKFNETKKRDLVEKEEARAVVLFVLEDLLGCVLDLSSAKVPSRVMKKRHASNSATEKGKEPSVAREENVEGTKEEGKFREGKKLEAGNQRKRGAGARGKVKGGQRRKA